MKIGSSLNLDMIHPKTKEMIKCQSKIIGKSEDYLYIDYPVDVKTRKTVFLHEGINVSATYIGFDHTPYFFNTKILKRVRLTVPALAIKLPDTNIIRRIQRREYVRIKTAADIAIHCPKKSFSPFTTVTLDMSGGGISIIVPSNESLSKVKKVNIWMVLQLQSGKYHYIYAEAEIIRTKSLENRIKTASLEFISIEKKAQQMIIQYCFEKQREARQKGLI